MAIDPKLVSIKKAGDLPSGIPTASGEFLYFEDETLMKAGMSDLYDRVESSYLGIITPSSTIPTTGSWYGTVLQAGTFNNVSPAITVDAADFDVENGTANNEVRIIISEGVATKDVRRVKGYKGDAADPAKLPLYSAIKSANIAAGTQFIDDENGNLIYRVKTGQTLLTTDTPRSAKTEQVSVTTSVNYFPNNGKLLHWNNTNTSSVSVVSGYYRFAGAGSVEINSMPATTVDRYIAITKATNIVGSPTFGYRNSGGVYVSIPIVVGTNLFVPAGSYKFEIIAGAGNSIDVAEVYIGDKPYNPSGVSDKINTKENYFKNTTLKNIPNVVTDSYGNKKIRIMGNDSEQVISLDFDKTNDTDYASVLFQSSVASVKTSTHSLNVTDLTVFTINTTLNAHTEAQHVVNRQFSATHPRVRIEVKFTGTTADWLEVYAPAITKSERNVTDVLTAKDVSGVQRLTSLMNDKPINLAPNNGDVKTYNFTALANISVSGEYMRFTGTTATVLLNIPAETYTRYFAIMRGANIIGTPKIGMRNPGGGIDYRNAEIGRSYAIPEGHYNIIVMAGTGGQIDISNIYLGDKPYDAEWVENSPAREIENYYANTRLNGFANRVVDAYGNASLRLQGNGAAQTIRVTFDKLNASDYASILFKTSATQLSIIKADLNSSGGSADGHSNSIKVFPNVAVADNRQFSAANPKVYIEVTFTGTSSDYLEVFSPAITKVERLVTDKLINKATTAASAGIAEYETLTDALAENPKGLIQVGRNLLTRKVPNPVLKSDYSLVNSNTEPQSNAKLMDIGYVDLGNWKLLLVTTDKKMIFVNTNIIKYTYDLEECLVPAVHATEKRFTLDDTKLTDMFTAIPARSIREMGNGELVMQTYNTSHYYTTNGQTTINTSTPHTPTIGSRIDGWAYDAFGDTVVFSTYAAAPNRADGSVMLSTDFGRTYTEVLNLATDAATYFPGIPLQSIHIHGVFIDAYRDSIVMLMGDYEFTEAVTGKVLVLRNYRTNTVWEMLPINFRNGPREQYCTGIALEKNLLFGTDMQETCISRMNIGDAGYNSKREWADDIIDGLHFIPNFTRAVEPNAPIGIHYSCTKTPDDVSRIYLTKDGFNFAKIYIDTVPHSPFANNNARVWCDIKGNVYCTQFNGRFTNELIIGKYNGFNMI